MNNLSDKEYWDKEWSVEDRTNYNKFIFSNLLVKFLPFGHHTKQFIEIGCAPGSIMTYFHHEMGYEVSGVDYSSKEIIDSYLQSQGIQNYHLYFGDFNQMEINERFDVVSSFGLIEHFNNYSEIIDKHKQLVNPGGYLVLEMPNLRFFNWLMYRLLNPKLLRMHNLKVMSKNALKQAVADNEFEILFNNYYKSCFLFYNEDNPELDRYPFFKKLFIGMKRTLSFLRLEDVPNRYFSPYMVLIAKRKGQVGDG